MILITGSTGQLGTAAIEQLLKQTSADNIVAFARDKAKAVKLEEKGIEVRIGNFDDKASLERALVSVDKVLLISGLDQNRLDQHKNVVDAAKNAGVKHIAYTGLAIKDIETSVVNSFMKSHFETEEYIIQSGLTYTFLRNSLYADALPMFVGGQVFDTGIYFPAGEGKVPFALRRELGEAAANALIQDGHDNKTYELAANELYSFDDVASALSELSGKSVRYTDVDAGQFCRSLVQAGVPESGIFMSAGFAEDIKRQQLEIVSNDLEHLLGRKPAILRDSLKEVYGF